MLNRQILCGDVLEKIKEIPDESIDCVITSPPYWGLRDYGVEGQLGLEPDFYDYLTKLHQVMVELKRVIKSTGSVWVNLGDTYYSKKIGSAKPTGLHGDNCKCGTCTSRTNPLITTVQRVPEKSRCFIPYRFAINCLTDDWICRNDIVWFKPNSIPDSVESKFPNTWESIFFFVKSNKYYLNVKDVEIHSKSKLFETKRQKDVFEIPVKRFHGFHTATFPEELVEKILKASCPKDGVVLDPFFGSGTVGVVAEKLGLQWSGIELKQEYVDMARKRLAPYLNERLMV